MARKRKVKERDIPYIWDELEVTQVPDLLEAYDMHGLQIYERWGGSHKDFVRSMPRVSHMFTGYSKPPTRRRCVKIA